MPFGELSLFDLFWQFLNIILTIGRVFLGVILIAFLVKQIKKG